MMKSFRAVPGITVLYADHDSRLEEFAEIYAKGLKLRSGLATPSMFRRYAKKVGEIRTISLTESGLVCAYKGIKFHIIFVDDKTGSKHIINVLKVTV